jgi:hypothetical protein
VSEYLRLLYQHTGQINDVRKVNRLFPNVIKFKYLGTTVAHWITLIMKFRTDLIWNVLLLSKNLTDKISVRLLLFPVNLHPEDGYGAIYVRP